MKNPAEFSNASACHVCPRETPGVCGRRWGAAPAGEPYARRGEGPYLFFVGALQLMSANLTRAVFSAPSVRTFVASARSRMWDEEAPLHVRWSCRSEDATIGFAVWKAATSQPEVRPTFVALAHGLRLHRQNAITDVQSLCESGAPIRISDRLTVHKLEVDEEALQRRVDREQSQNDGVFRQLHIPPQYFVRAIAQCNRRARRFLETEAASYSSASRSRRTSRWALDCTDPHAAPHSGTPSAGFSTAIHDAVRGGATREALDFYDGVQGSARWRFCSATIAEHDSSDGEPSTANAGHARLGNRSAIVETVR